MKPLRWIKRCLMLGFLVAVTYFFAITLASAFSKIEGTDLTPDLLTLTSVICFAVAVLTCALLWRSILNSSIDQAALGRMESVNLYISAWLLKYLPGKAWSYGYRAMMANSKGIGMTALLHSFTLETLCIVIASTIPAIPIVLIVTLADPTVELKLLAPLLFLIPLLALIYPPAFRKAGESLAGFLRKLDPEFVAKTPKALLLKVQAGYVVSRILNGVAFVLIAASLFGVTSSMWLPLIAFYMLAGILGSLAFFAPSGLGVREGVLIALSIQYFSLEQAALLAVVTRLYTILADVLLALMVVPAHFRKWASE